MNNYSSILITGANGFVGKNLIEFLQKNGYHNLIGLYHTNKPIIDGVEWHPFELTRSESYENLIQEDQFVIHLAAKISYESKDIDQLYQVNVRATESLVNICLLKKVKKLIFVSSASTLTKSHDPTRVSDKTQGKPFFYSTYAKTKYLGELEIHRAQAEGLDTCILNPCLILGEGDWNTGSLSLLKRMAKGLKFYPVGSLGIVDIQTVCQSIINVMKEIPDPGPILLHRYSISFKKLIEIVCNHIGTKPPLRALSPWMYRSFIFVEKLKSWFGKSKNIVTTETAKISSTSFSYEGSDEGLLNGSTSVELEKLVIQCLNFNINNK